MNTPFSDNNSTDGKAEQTDFLDALFNSAKDTEPYLKDDGFSDKVIATLPANKPLSNGKKNALIMGSAVMGSACAAAMMPSLGSTIGQLFTQTFSVALGIPALAAIAGGLLVISGAVIWANHREWI